VALQISIRESADIAILDLRGRLTINDDACGLLHSQLQELIAEGARKFLLNLADLIQIDSSGVSIIVKTYRSLRGQSGDLRLLRPSGHALEVFRALHLLEMIPSFEEEKLALVSFSPVGCLAKP
jgi:anti-anti-sigma factor